MVEPASAKPTAVPRKGAEQGVASRVAKTPVRKCPAMPFGAGVAAGTAYAIALHALLLIPIVVLGLLLLWRRHITFRWIRHADAVLGSPETAGAAASDAPTASPIPSASPVRD